MGVNVKTKYNKLPTIEHSLNGIKGKKVIIGVLNGSHKWLAGIHEYGLKIEVTDKMRAFLHSEGLHLKDSTQYIEIPERAFLRNGHDENADRIITQTERMLPFVIQGKISVDTMLEKCGEQFVTAIKDYMSQTQANHPFTIERKGTSTPLTGTSGALVEGVAYKVEG